MSSSSSKPCLVQELVRSARRKSGLAGFLTQTSSSSLEAKMLGKARGLAGDCCRMAPEPRWDTGEE